MADKHIVNREAQWVALNTCPDFCKVGKKIIPFEIARAADNELMNYATTVFARGEPVVMLDSVFNGVEGDAGKGTASGASQGSGHVWIKAGSPTVFAEGRPVTRHLDKCWMHCS